MNNYQILVAGPQQVSSSSENASLRSSLMCWDILVLWDWPSTLQLAQDQPSPKHSNPKRYPRVLELYKETIVENPKH